MLPKESELNASCRKLVCCSEWLPQTKYFAPAREGLKPWQMGALSGNRRRHLETKVDVVAEELYLKSFITIWTPDEIYLDFETGILH